MIRLFLVFLTFVGCATQKTKNLRTGEPNRTKEYAEYWEILDSGMAALKAKDLLEAKKLYLSCHEKFQKNLEAKPELYRIAGLCLKKLGYIERIHKNYELAAYYHQLRLSYVKDYGSAWEVYDSYISLDVDAYFLKNFHLSSIMLLKAITYGKLIKDSQKRFLALGTAHNNLAGTLYSLEKFKSAEQVSKLALDYWQKYEKRAGTKEMKLPWAYYTIGDVYENWIKHAKEEKLKISLKSKALKEYEKAKSLGASRKMDNSSLDVIEKAIERVKKL